MGIFKAIKRYLAYRKLGKQISRTSNVTKGLFLLGPPNEIQLFHSSLLPDWGIAEAAFIFQDFDRCIGILDRINEELSPTKEPLCVARIFYNKGITLFATGDLRNALQVLKQGFNFSISIRADLAREYRELIEDANKFQGTGVRVMGIPNNERHLELLFLRAMSLIYAELDQSDNLILCKQQIRKISIM